jgi:hypothetical protein
MNIKSERLKKLENELHDLEQWMTLGLVPKSDINKHSEEIKQIKAKVKEEIERLKFMKENGDAEEYVAPKRSQQKQVYQEPQTLPDMDVGNDYAAEGGIDIEPETFDLETSTGDEKSSTSEDVTIVEEDDPFSDKNRWKRGILEDPDADNW